MCPDEMVGATVVDVLQQIILNGDVHSNYVWLRDCGLCHGQCSDPICSHTCATVDRS
jgi:hypothetical protein